MNLKKSLNMFLQMVLAVLIVFIIQAVWAIATGSGAGAGDLISVALGGSLAGLGIGSITAEPNLRQASSAYRDLAFEDLMDVLDLFDPAATPVMSLAATEAKLNNTTTDWEVD
jgi:hypothetical protein